MNIPEHILQQVADERHARRACRNPGKEVAK